MNTTNEGWKKRLNRRRRALETKIAVTHAFWGKDLEAIGYVTGRDEPTRGDLRRWTLAVVRHAVEEAQRRMEEANRPEDLDIPF